MYRLTEICLIILIPNLLFCQSGSRIMHFNTNNSLIPSDVIYCIEVDSSNNKWIGTDKGLAKFDGKKWTNYSIANGLFRNKVLAIAFDKNGATWIVDSVLSKYDGVKWTNYSEPKYLNIPYNSRQLVIDENNVKWLVRSNSSLVSFNDTVFTDHLFLSGIRSIKCFENDIWIATYNKIYKYSKGVLTDCSWDKNTNNNIVLMIDDMQIDTKGDKWVLGKIMKYGPGDSFTEELHLFQLRGIDDYKEINVICDVKYSYGLKLELENDIKWIGVLHYGLVKLTNTSCFLYNHANDSLLTNVVGIIAVDKQRNKWVSATNDWYNMGVSVFNENGVVITSVINGDYLPSLYSLEQNYPNPFNPFTKISFTIPKYSHVTLKVFDVLGKEISTLVDKGYIAGKFEVEFNGNNLSSGIYFYTLSADDYKETKKLLLIK